MSLSICRLVSFTVSPLLEPQGQILVPLVHLISLALFLSLHPIVLHLLPSLSTPHPPLLLNTPPLLPFPTLSSFYCSFSAGNFWLIFKIQPSRACSTVGRSDSGSRRLFDSLTCSLGPCSGSHDSPWRLESTATIFHRITSAHQLNWVGFPEHIFHIYSSLFLPSVAPCLHFPFTPAPLHLFLNVLSPALHLSITFPFFHPHLLSLSLHPAAWILLHISQPIALLLYLSIPALPESWMRNPAV